MYLKKCLLWKNDYERPWKNKQLHSVLLFSFILILSSHFIFQTKCCKHQSQWRKSGHKYYISMWKILQILQNFIWTQETDTWQVKSFQIWKCIVTGQPMIMKLHLLQKHIKAASVILWPIFTAFPSMHDKLMKNSIIINVQNVIRSFTIGINIGWSFVTHAFILKALLSIVTESCMKQ